MFPWARLSVYQLDPDARQRLEKAAKLQKQSSGAFLERAGEERARKVLLEWTVSRYRQEVQSLSELASETGLVVEEIVDALGDSGREEAVEMFLASCRTVAETQGDMEFLRLGEKAVKGLSQATS